MKSSNIAVFVIVVVVILAVIFVYSKSSGNPIIPQTYDLTCIDYDTGKLLQVDVYCDSIEDCITEMKNNACSLGNICNNERIECKDHKCVEVVFFRWDRSCV